MSQPALTAAVALCASANNVVCTYSNSIPVRSGLETLVRREPTLKSRDSTRSREYALLYTQYYTNTLYMQRSLVESLQTRLGRLDQRRSP